MGGMRTSTNKSWGVPPSKTLVNGSYRNHLYKRDTNVSWVRLCMMVSLRYISLLTCHRMIPRNNCHLNWLTMWMVMLNNNKRKCHGGQNSVHFLMQMLHNACMPSYDLEDFSCKTWNREKLVFWVDTGKNGRTRNAIHVTLPLGCTCSQL